MLDQINTMIEAIMEDERFIPNVAKLIRKLYEALVAEGFTELEATKIVANYKITG